MNTEWITDRLPTAKDALTEGSVWTFYDGKVMIWSYDGVELGTPWQPITKPTPYVKPKRWSLLSLDNGWILRDKNNCCYLPSCSREAAERIADVFNEVMP